MASLSSLTAVLAYGIALCGSVPLFPWLETVPRLILAAGMAAGIWQDLRGAWPLKNWQCNAAIVPVFLFYAVQFSRANPVQPVVSVLAVMLAVRLAGPKNARHYLQIAALSLFCLASSSLFDLSPAFLVYLVLMLLLPYAPAERDSAPIRNIPAKSREFVGYVRSKFSVATN